MTSFSVLKCIRHWVLLEGGKRVSYGQKVYRGRLRPVPVGFPAQQPIGCSAGFVNVPRIKGSHNAMETGIMAAEAAFEVAPQRARHDS